MKRKRNALLNQLDNGAKNEADDFEGDLARLFDCEYLPVIKEHALNDDHFYTEREDHEFQGNNDCSEQYDDVTDIFNQENQITAVPETFESSDLEQITVPLYPLQDLVMKEGIHDICRTTPSNQFYFCSDWTCMIVK